MTSYDAHILGAGMIGLCIAESLSRQGLKVVVSDPYQAQHNASWAAAGMIAPMAEWLDHGRGDSDCLNAWLRAASFWTEFTDRLESQTGIAIGYRKSPTLFLAPAEGSNTSVARSHLDVACELPPGLAPNEHLVFWLDSDGQVDNRQTLLALHEVLRGRGVDIRSDAEGLRIDWTIEAMGWRARDVVPVKGQALSLKPHRHHPKTVIRFPGGYIVPKSDRTLIGATSEPGVKDNSTDDAAIAEMRRRAEKFWPSLAGDQEIDRWAGIRPKPASQTALLREYAPKRLQIGGHYRNGILLAPFTAHCVTSHVLGDDYPAGATSIFGPSVRRENTNA